MVDQRFVMLQVFAQYVVASLTSVAGPHQGSPVADLILKAEGTAVEAPLVGAVNFVSKAIVWAQGLDPTTYPHDALAGGSSLTLAGSAKYNAAFPLGLPKSNCADGNSVEKGIYNYSFTGVGQITNILDLDSALKVTALLIDGGKDNDGLVSRCSAKFGKTIRDNYNWNHLDEVNQVLGLQSIIRTRSCRCLSSTCQSFKTSRFITFIIHKKNAPKDAFFYSVVN